MSVSHFNHNSTHLCMDIRIGTGFDVHKLEEGLPFRLGGINIPHYKGAKGHSDADTLIHAICDAMFGALALGDIGVHFPNTSEEFKDINSLILLQRTHKIIKSKGFDIINIDSVVILQKPKIAPYIDEMRNVLAKTLGIKIESISIKATSTEKLGFVGNEDGVAVNAVVLLKKL